jgi:hypothetical protein
MPVQMHLDAEAHVFGIAPFAALGSATARGSACATAGGVGATSATGEIIAMDGWSVEDEEDVLTLLLLAS